MRNLGTPPTTPETIASPNRARPPLVGLPALAELLNRTSSTLGLAIRLLPEPLRQEVSVAHLLFRVISILDHADLWMPCVRVSALRELDALIASSASRFTPLAASSSERWCRTSPCDDHASLEVIGALPMVLAEGRALHPAAWGSIVRHARRAISGLISFATRSGTPLDAQLHDEDDVRRYAYAVAGVFGELITELFVEGGYVPQSAQRPLWRCANAFGEGLELVSTLRAPTGSRPPSRARAELAAIAAEDLGDAELYVRTLRQSGAGFGVVSYAHLSLRLLRGTSFVPRTTTATGDPADA